VAVIGSHARGTARPDSDLDIVLLTTDPARYLSAVEWAGRFGPIRSTRREDWGAIQSLRVFYEGGREVEFGVGSPAWAGVEPVDPGTRRAAAGGLPILFERDGVLTALLDALAL
jgi:hypothetical protein